MLVVLLLAVALAHPPIDRAFKPDIGDHVSMGTIPVDKPDAAVDAALCFSTVEKVQLYFASIEPELESDVQPDGYLVRAGTHVVVRDRQVVQGTLGGKPRRLNIAKVEILGGEFEGMTLFVLEWNLYRYVDRDYPASERTAAKKRSARKRSPGAAAVQSGAKLVLMDLTSNLSQTGNYVNVDGRVRCTSDAPMAFVGFTVSFEDAEGKLVRSETGFCTPANLNPGELASISVTTQSDRRYARVKIDFRDSLKSIPWSDQSGANAHQ